MRMPRCQSASLKHVIENNINIQLFCSWHPSIPTAMNNLLRPNFLSCQDCSVTNWKFAGSSSNLTAPRGAEVAIKFCTVHRTNFRVPPIADSTQPPPASVPGTTTRFLLSSRGIQPSVASSSANAPASSTSDGSSSIHTSRSTVCWDTLCYYQRAKITMVEKQLSLPKTLAHLGIDKRTFNRKRRITELQILDQTEFERLMEGLSRSQHGRVISRETLSTECKRILQQGAMLIKERRAKAKEDIL